MQGRVQLPKFLVLFTGCPFLTLFAWPLGASVAVHSLLCLFEKHRIDLVFPQENGDLLYGASNREAP